MFTGLEAQGIARPLVHLNILLRRPSGPQEDECGRENPSTAWTAGGAHEYGQVLDLKSGA